MERKPRVLGVDDKPGNLLALEAVLGDRYELVTAQSGPEALSILERDPGFDVILMDLQMPGMDGYEAATRIKRMPE
ncbi:MAG: response regulator, partial [Polyangiaceae bacterium]